MLFLIIGCLTLVSAQKPCPQDWDHIPQLDSCFLLPSQPSDWTSAEEYCSHVNGHLVGISNEKEAEIVKRLFEIKNPSFLNWIGLRWDKGSQNFTWSDGSSLDFSLFLPGEPTESSNCVAWILENNIDGWQTISCFYSQFFMCRKSVEKNTTIWHFDVEGVIESPGYPESYNNEEYETHIIQTTPGTRILLNFEEIETEKNRDFITVTDGYSLMFDYQKKLSGSHRNYSIAINNNQVVIHFSSDKENVDKGFRMSYKTLHPLPTKVYSNSFGIITSNNYPESPDSYLIQNYKVICPIDHHVALRLKEIQLDRNDRIKIHNGNDEKSDKLQIFNIFNNRFDVLKSTKESIFIAYSTGVQTNRNNFWKFEYNCVADGNLGEEIEI